jgi:hypothetical protein
MTGEGAHAITDDDTTADDDAPHSYAHACLWWVREISASQRWRNAAIAGAFYSVRVASVACVAPFLARALPLCTRVASVVHMAAHSGRLESVCGGRIQIEKTHTPEQMTVKREEEERAAKDTRRHAHRARQPTRSGTSATKVGHREFARGNARAGRWRHGRMPLHGDASHSPPSSLYSCVVDVSACSVLFVVDAVSIGRSPWSSSTSFHFSSSISPQRRTKNNRTQSQAVDEAMSRTRKLPVKYERHDRSEAG